MLPRLKVVCSDRKFSFGYTLTEVMVAVGLLAVVLLVAMDGSRIISKLGRQEDRMGESDEISRELGLILGVPGNCSCNFRNVSISDLKSTVEIPSLGFYSKTIPCNNQKPTLIAGQTFNRDGDGSGASPLIKSIRMGPFYPVGNQGAYLADVVVETSLESTGQSVAMRPYVYPILTFMTRVNENYRPMKCGGTMLRSMGGGIRSAQVNAPLTSERLLRFTEVRVYKNCDPTHFATVKNIRSARIDYFWPYEFGDVLASENLSSQGLPVSWALNPSANPVCHELKIPGVRVVKLLTHPNRILDTCNPLKQRFLNGPPFAVTNVGQRVVYPCGK